MKCIRCDSNDTKCVDDMMLQNYFAELYKCNKCGGMIEVEYKSSQLSMENFKSYSYFNDFRWKGHTL